MSESDEARLLQSITPTEEDGVFEIRSGPFVGRLGLPSGRWIDFRSRFDFEDVVELIRASTRPPIRVDRLAAPASGGRFLIDLIVVAFSRETGRLVAAGLAKGYRERRFDRPPYPGRIDVMRQLAEFAGRSDRLVTRARRITLDIPLNQALALALDVLTRLPLRGEIRHHLRRLRPAFARVGRPPMDPDAIRRMDLDRLTTRYQVALSLAELILRSQTLVPQEVGARGASILFNMAMVWESYVAQYVAAEWGGGYRVKAPHRFDLTTDGRVRSAADVTVWDGSRPVALYDAKYKWPGSTPDVGDLYQMVAYCQRLGLTEANLVYPAAFEPRSFRVDGITVRMVGLPVDRADLREKTEVSAR